MDANANANPIVPPQAVAPPTNCWCPRVMKAAILLLSSIDVVLPWIIISHAPNGKTYKAVHVISFFLPGILLCCTEIFTEIDQACHPKVISWVAAFVLSSLGAVYPAIFHLSKPHWVVIVSWVILANHVLTIALMYYNYLLKKGFGDKLVHPLPPGTEEIV